MRILLSVFITAILATPLASQASTVIHAGKFIDGKSETPQSEVTIVIDEGKITSIAKGFAAPKEGDKLISDKTIPAGNDYPTVVQIRAKKGAKPVNEKFNLNMDKCPTCEYLEYACTCEHGEEGHDHKEGKETKKETKKEK